VNVIVLEEAATTAVGSDVAGVEPTLLVAVTTTRIVEPMSALDNV
jgi:hypothetical protein